MRRTTSTNSRMCNRHCRPSTLGHQVNCRSSTLQLGSNIFCQGIECHWNYIQGAGEYVQGQMLNGTYWEQVGIAGALVMVVDGVVGGDDFGVGDAVVKLTVLLPPLLPPPPPSLRQPCSPVSRFFTHD